ncbi:ubiquitin-like protein 7 isoform X1 [Tachypleus tridentatus]|uniref:ubiquitin-like protein 7 isoform X1 n=1 Tax=Tachypleus tridentatus TaxID=6853 RepID=UPI003FD63ED1
MMAMLYVKYRSKENGKNFEKNKFSGINLSSSVEKFKENVASKLNMKPFDIELICFGKCLKSEETLESCGLKHGMTVYVLPKQHPDPEKSHEELSQKEIRNRVSTLKTALGNLVLKNMLRQLSKPEVIENIVATNPGLADDPVAIAILQDPDMLVQLSFPDNIKKLVENHPSLPEAVAQVAAAFQEDNASGQMAMDTLQSAVSYSLDALSDDEDMENDHDRFNETANFLTGRGLSGLGQVPITSNDLASALATLASTPSRQGDVGYGSQPSTSTSTPRQGTPSTSQGVITPEMFNHAMQQALGVVRHTSNMESQLQQLRDMGISDDSVSLRALHTTGGDVQAALELIFGEGGGQNSV